MKKLSLGIELGSTTIKAVLIDESFNSVATGSYEWENKLEGGYWTYDLADAEKGLSAAYMNLKANYKNKYGETLKHIDSLGISGMMHGYLPFDKDFNLLCPFRTWRNTTTEKAAKELTKSFNFNIPQRWSIAHLYEAILNGESHIKDINSITTLSVYIHKLLSGNLCVGIGEASGMFPIDSATKNWDAEKMRIMDEKLKEKGMPYKINDILPKVLSAGENAGCLTEEGALILDPEGDLEAGIPMCPPEGDAGTGMVATNSVLPTTGNVSAGTSIFAMVVLKESLKNVYEEIDVVTTPDGAAVGMVHCNNCTSDLNAWANMLSQFTGGEKSRNKVLDMIFDAALSAEEKDAGGVISYNYLSGEHISGVKEGRPMILRTPESKFTFENFSRSLVFSAVATLRYGMNFLFDKENVEITRLTGHGGLFKAGDSGRILMAAALKSPVSVTETAAQGGAWGMAVLSAYLLNNTESLADFLEKKVFVNAEIKTSLPDETEAKGFEAYLEKYLDSLETERNAYKYL
ncbi:MAG: ATPase [Ruminococcaceae bacterium]|nr:ATPase [Oscillospiraceae bacterium]